MTDSKTVLTVQGILHYKTRKVITATTELYNSTTAEP
jgi:hypothetical protein